MGVKRASGPRPIQSGSGPNRSWARTPRPNCGPRPTINPNEATLSRPASVASSAYGSRPAAPRGYQDAGAGQIRDGVRRRERRALPGVGFRQRVRGGDSGPSPLSAVGGTGLPQLWPLRNPRLQPVTNSALSDDRRHTRSTPWTARPRRADHSGAAAADSPSCASPKTRPADKRLPFQL